MTQPQPRPRNEREVTVVPLPLQESGHTDWRALAELLAENAPDAPPGGARIPVPEGWVEIPMMGFDQSLFLESSARYEGIMSQVTVRRVNSQDGPVSLLSGQAPRTGLLLGIEPWTAGTWRGLHAAWSLSRFGGTILRRLWILDAGDGRFVEVCAEYNAYMARHLTVLTNGMAAGLQPAPRNAGDIQADLDWSGGHARRARSVLAASQSHELPQALTLERGDLEWLVGAATGSNSTSTMIPPDRVLASGLAAPEGRLTRTGRTLTDLARGRNTSEAEVRVETGRPGRRGGIPVERGRVWPAGPACLVEQRRREAPDSAAGESAAVELVELGAYHRDDAPDMILRLVGHRAEGPSDVPVDLLPAEAFRARLLDSSAPLPAGLPDGANVSQALDPQDIYRWWTADWSWWAISRGQGEGTEGLRVLTVSGFGHYLWEGVGGPSGTGGTAVRLRPVDGLALFGVLAELVGQPSG